MGCTPSEYLETHYVLPVQGAIKELDEFDVILTVHRR